MARTKRKTKGRAALETDLAREAFRVYRETGDTTALGALADQMDESGNGKRMAAFIRKVAQKRDRDIWFFYVNGGCAYHPNRETPEFGLLRGAVKLAQAEDWAESRFGDDLYPEPGDIWFNWEEDEDYNPRDYDSPDMPELGWVCILNEYTARDGWKPLQVLCGITFGGNGYPSGDPYKRVVEAELALEAMHG